VHVHGNVADVHVRYSCDVGTHLWVSAKESAGGAIDPDISAKGSGQLQKGWAWVQFCVTTDEDLGPRPDGLGARRLNS
jgi:hypothetical protein